jgi:hypothetical protein
VRRLLSLMTLLMSWSRVTHPLELAALSASLGRYWCEHGGRDRHPIDANPRLCRMCLVPALLSARALVAKALEPSGHELVVIGEPIHVISGRCTLDPSSPKAFLAHRLTSHLSGGKLAP